RASSRARTETRVSVAFARLIWRALMPAPLRSTRGEKSPPTPSALFSRKVAIFASPVAASLERQNRENDREAKQRDGDPSPERHAPERDHVAGSGARSQPTEQTG